MISIFVKTLVNVAYACVCELANKIHGHHCEHYEHCEHCEQYNQHTKPETKMTFFHRHFSKNLCQQNSNIHGKLRHRQQFCVGSSIHRVLFPQDAIKPFYRTDGQFYTC